ncbi:hypothetical protein DKX38_018349 [Salix brachista]|uniref:ABC transmembrane type-1 domain-containing protein n=1 Tax=Salix brachista TaxID=2182728 RepID=A0A5N5KMS6_9ROSI|nr:hypothetical protein DKX38_018349 [Salix brachista]
MRGALDGFLLSTSPVFVSAATFAACYFMKTLLRASKVFIFVSTYVLLEKQLDMSGKSSIESGNYAVSIKSADFSREENSSKSALRNMSLELDRQEHRALLRGSRISVLDEATSSIDNATDLILQKATQTEFSNRTVITACTMVLFSSGGMFHPFNSCVNALRFQNMELGLQHISERNHYDDGSKEKGSGQGISRTCSISKNYCRARKGDKKNDEEQLSAFKYQVMQGNFAKMAIFARASGIYQSSQPSQPIKKD